MPVAPLPTGLDWLLVTGEPLPAAEALAWAALPSCGGVVTFCGTVRDHAEGREGVVALEYEAYEEHAERRLAEVAAATRSRVPETGRLALLHRTGRLVVGEVSVVVVASAPHRAEAFDAARFAIDTVKATVPIWKREEWSGGVAWSACDHALGDGLLGSLPGPAGGSDGPR